MTPRTADSYLVKDIALDERPEHSLCTCVRARPAVIRALVLTVLDELDRAEPVVNVVKDLRRHIDKVGHDRPELYRVCSVQDNKEQVLVFENRSGRRCGALALHLNEPPARRHAPPDRRRPSRYPPPPRINTASVPAYPSSKDCKQCFAF